MANQQIERAFTTRADKAKRAVERSYPNAADITVSIAFGRVIVDFIDGDEPRRVEHHEEEDQLAAEQADAATRIKRVHQGVLV
jgi:hypothetical protein